MIRFFNRPSKTLSQTALGVALAFGAPAGMAIAPTAAFAQDGPEMTRGFRGEVVKVQEALQAAQAQADASAKASGLNQALGLLNAAKPKIGNAKDRYTWGQFAFNISREMDDKALEMQGLDAMLQSGLSPPDQAQSIATALGQMSFNAENYDAAQNYLRQAIGMGSQNAELSALLAETYWAQENWDAGFAAIDEGAATARANGQPVEQSWFRRALAVAYQNNLQAQTVQRVQALLANQPSKDDWGDGILIVRTSVDHDDQTALDYLRLMQRTGSYKEGNNLREHIEIADPRRLPGEVIAVIDDGYASGMIDRSDANISTIYTEARAAAERDRPGLADEQSDLRANGSAAATTGLADAYLSYGEPALAEEFYRLALQRPGVETEKVMTRLGIALFDQGKFGEAQETFQQISGARKAVADLWTTYAAQNAR